MIEEGAKVILSQATIRVYKQTKIGDDICFRTSSSGEMMRGIITAIVNEDAIDQTPIVDPQEWQWYVNDINIGTSRSITDIYPAAQIYTDPQN